MPARTIPTASLSHRRLMIPCPISPLPENSRQPAANISPGLVISFVPLFFCFLLRGYPRGADFHFHSSVLFQATCRHQPAQGLVGPVCSLVLAIWALEYLAMGLHAHADILVHD